MKNKTEKLFNKVFCCKDLKFSIENFNIPPVRDYCFTIENFTIHCAVQENKEKIVNFISFYDDWNRFDTIDLDPVSIDYFEKIILPYIEKEQCLTISDDNQKTNYIEEFEQLLNRHCKFPMSKM